jgi:hypothetical protein
MSRPATILAVAALVTGCWQSPPSQNGTDQQFRVRYKDLNTGTTVDAQFERGPFPGLPLRDGGYPAAPDGGVLAAPNVSGGSLVVAGQAGESLGGLVDKRASSVALTLQGVSTGYWVVPAGNPDSTTDELTWSAILDYGIDVPPGFREIRVAAFGADGTVSGTTLHEQCVVLDIPSLYLCKKRFNAKFVPPKAIISLTWDTAADLDLQVKTPEGVLVDPKHLATEQNDAGAIPASAGYIDHDSNANCSPDVREENLIFQNEAPHGLYTIWVNEFDSCKQAATRFKVTIYETTPTVELPDGGQKYGDVREVWSQGGELLDIQANGGTARGLYVNQYRFR